MVFLFPNGVLLKEKKLYLLLFNERPASGWPHVGQLLFRGFLAFQRADATKRTCSFDSAFKLCSVR